MEWELKTDRDRLGGLTNTRRSCGIHIDTSDIVNPVTSVRGSNNLSSLYPCRLSRSDRNFGPAQVA